MINLMNHNAGFEEMYFNCEVTKPEDIVSLDICLTDYAPRQSHRPGEVTAYSNYGAALAAKVVECVSGQTFSDYVHKHIFEPLGMENTAILPDSSDNPKVATAREKMNSYAYYIDSKEDLGTVRNFISIYPAGATCGSFADFMRFADALAPWKISPLFRSADTIKTFFQATQTYGETDVARVCHGLWTLPYGNTVIGHSGNSVGYSSGIYFDPVQKMAIAVMSNEVGEIAYNYSLMGEVFGKWKVEFSPITQPERLEGFYLASRATFAHGFAKSSPYHTLFLPLQATDDATVYKIALTPNLSIKQVADKLFIMSDGDGLETVKYLQETENGPVLQGYTMDEYKVSNLNFYSHVALLISFVVILALSLVYAFVALVKWIMAVRNKNKTPELQRIKQQSFLGLASSTITLLVGYFVYLLVFSDVLLTKLQAQMLSGSILGLSILAVGLLFYNLFKDKGKNRMQLVQLCILLCNCLYWEWYRFWI